MSITFVNNGKPFTCYGSPRLVSGLVAGPHITFFSGREIFVDKDGDVDIFLIVDGPIKNCVKVVHRSSGNIAIGFDKSPAIMNDRKWIFKENSDGMFIIAEKSTSSLMNF